MVKGWGFVGDRIALGLSGGVTQAIYCHTIIRLSKGRREVAVSISYRFLPSWFGRLGRNNGGPSTNDLAISPSQPSTEEGCDDMSYRHARAKYPTAPPGEGVM